MSPKWIKWVVGSAGVGVFTFFLALTQPAKSTWTTSGFAEDPTPTPIAFLPDEMDSTPADATNNDTNNLNDELTQQQSESSLNSNDTSKAWLVFSKSEMEGILQLSQNELKQRQLLLENLDWSENDTISLQTMTPSRTVSPAPTPMPTKSPAVTQAPSLSTPKPTPPKSDRKTRRS